MEKFEEGGKRDVEEEETVGEWNRETERASISEVSQQHLSESVTLCFSPFSLCQL